MQYFIFAVRIILFMLFPLSLIATNDHDMTTTCEGLSCQNGGSCVQKADTYRCHCQLGYKGILCEQAWLTEEKFTNIESTLQGLSEKINAAQLMQLTQYGKILSLKHQLALSEDYKSAVNWPRFFIPWATLNLSEMVIDSSFLLVGDKLILTTLITSSHLQIFELRNQSNFVEIQSLTLSYAQSVMGFHIGGRSCFAVAQSKRMPRDGEHEVKSLLYCWNASSKTFTKHQELATRGAVHVELVSIGQSFFLIVSCSRRGKNSNSLIYSYVWSEQRQQFLLYQYLPSEGAISTKAITTQHSTYLTVREVDGLLHTTKIFIWNGTYFSQKQLVSSETGFIFAVGHSIFKIADSNIYTLDLYSKEFVFHSVLAGSRNRTNAYSFFTVSNEFYLAETQYGRNGIMSLLIYRMNGFDFTPYQNLALQSDSFSVKVLWLHQSGVLLAIMYDNVLKLFKWSHM